MEFLFSYSTLVNISLVHRHSLVRYQVQPVVTEGVSNRKTWFADHKTNIFSLAVLLAAISPGIMLMMATKSLMNGINLCCPLFWGFRKNFQRILQKQGMKFKLNTMVTSKLTLYVYWLREVFFVSVNGLDVCSQ